MTVRLVSGLFTLFLLRALGNAETSICVQLKPKMESAIAALNRFNTAEAERSLATIEGARNECPAILLVMARVQAARKNVEQGSGLFERYMKAQPKDTEGPFRFGEMLLQIGQFPQADAMADRALELDADHSGALALKGRLLTIRGQTAEGQRLLERAILIDPQNAEAHFQLGSLFDRTKENEKAVAHFEAVVALRPTDQRAYDYLGLNLEQLGQTDRAENAFKRGLAVNAGPLADSFLDFNYGRFLLKQNRLVESKSHLDRAVEIAPRVRAVLYERGKVNLRMGKYEAAAQDAQRALDTPDAGGVILDLQVYYLLAEAYSRLGDANQAASYIHLAEAAKIPPKPMDRK